MIPSRDELGWLYAANRMTTRQIAAHYHVSDITIRRWLQRRGIPVRPRGVGRVARGLEPVTAETLYQLVHVEHQPLREIGSLYGVHHTAVLGWLDRCGIERPVRWVTRRRRSL